MKVKDLIEQLQSLDPELEVFTSGYEAGYKDIERIGKPEDFILNWNIEWYYGPHELLRNVEVYQSMGIELQEHHKIIKGIVL